ncbi:MAG: diphthine--ammonia ligase [Dehalococcoidia bacterium]|jgi:ABC transporter with metal-binding/Fe-S-binding domain ATP-binding protein|nr:diphthine--ammonia ligase [Dehalococcoidia bacterium]
MKLAVLFSGGKDSYLSLQYASIDHEVNCLLTLYPEREDSWMFHTPAIEWTKLQAEALGLNHLTSRTSGVKEKELEDLYLLINSAISECSIEGVVTGALASVYQATRIQRICNSLNLWCFNPLWQMPQKLLLAELQANNVESVITGVAAEPFDDTWLGRTIDSECVEELTALESKYGINPAGEGGEIESFVRDAPLFKRSIRILESTKHYSNFAGRLEIKEAKLE